MPRQSATQACCVVRAPCGVQVESGEEEEEGSSRGRREQSVALILIHHSPLLSAQY